MLAVERKLMNVIMLQIQFVSLPEQRRISSFTKNPKVQSPTERPFRLRARNLVTMSVANERGEVKGESSWILVEHASSKHLEVIQSWKTNQN